MQIPAVRQVTIADAQHAGVSPPGSSATPDLTSPLGQLKQPPTTDENTTNDIYQTDQKTQKPIT